MLLSYSPSEAFDVCDVLVTYFGVFATYVAWRHLEMVCLGCCIRAVHSTVSDGVSTGGLGQAKLMMNTING